MIVNVLFIGDIVGRPGRQTVSEFLPGLKKKYSLDVVAANAENAAGGNGITPSVARELFDAGIDFLTTGNHVWDKREVLDFIDTEERIIRPANYPPGTPGTGFRVVSFGKFDLGFINISGNVFMPQLDCPFRILDDILPQIKKQTNAIIVDIHAEATSEKIALGWHLDGRVSAVLGTHTHVQTADGRILPQGTAYITDVGMTGPYNSILGVKTDLVLQKFRQKMPVRFEVAPGPCQLNAALLQIDTAGRALAIEPVLLRQNQVR